MYCSNQCILIVIRTVPVYAGAKCCTADKSTKTDDMVVNGAATDVAASPPESSTPSTTNAATMTDVSQNPPATTPQVFLELLGSFKNDFL